MPIIGGRQASVRGLGFQGAGAPAQVTGLTATNLGSGRAFNNGRIDLSWTAPANNGAPITGYFIERSTNSGSTWSTLVANTGNTNVSYSDTGLTSAQRYDYRISAINAVGTGLASTAANATATTVPQAPTIGTATAGDAQATVTYTANATGGSAITGFTATSSPGSLTGTGASPITVTGLSNGTAYTFTVTATNANGTSAASAASNSVTPVVRPIVSGGTLTSDATYYYRTFTSNGTLSVSNANLVIDYVVVSGGGAGHRGYRDSDGGLIYSYGGGGGGAGGKISVTNLTLSTGNYPITIGAGGTSPASGGGGSRDGTRSNFRGDQPIGGGSGGGVCGSSGIVPGGGGGYWYSNDGARSTGAGGGSGGGTQGGGNAITSPNHGGGGGGGGGHSTNGANGSFPSGSSVSGGNGGNGTTNFIFGTIGGGGGGSAGALFGSETAGSAGSGGAGAGSIRGNAPTDATANTGSGGGGAGPTNTSFTGRAGGNGGSGIVYIRYTRSQVE